MQHAPGRNLRFRHARLGLLRFIHPEGLRRGLLGSGPPVKQPVGLLFQGLDPPCHPTGAIQVQCGQHGLARTLQPKNVGSSGKHASLQRVALSPQNKLGPLGPGLPLKGPNLAQAQIALSWTQLDVGLKLGPSEAT